MYEDNKNNINNKENKTNNYMSFEQLVSKWSKFTFSQRELLGESELKISKMPRQEAQETYRNYLHLIRDCNYLDIEDRMNFILTVSIISDSLLFKRRYKTKFSDYSEKWLYYCEEFFITWFELFSQTDVIEGSEKINVREILVYILEYILSRYYIKLPSEIDSIDFNYQDTK